MMEVSNTHNIDYSILNNNVSSSKTVKPVIDNQLKTDQSTAVETNVYAERSSLASQLSQKMQNIASLQKTQQLLTQQTSIAQKVGTIVQDAPSQEALNRQYENLKELTSSYNQNGTAVSQNITNVIENMESEDSRMFFDGVPGSIPLSVEEINKAVEEQMQTIDYLREKISESFKKLSVESRQVIDEQKRPEVKNIDFKVESEQFATKAFEQIQPDLANTAAASVDSKSFEVIV
jgi:Zn-dependent M32 family carboxypeptidase